MKERAIAFGKNLFQQFQDDDVPGIGAELAYRFLFAVFPFGIFLAALGAFVAQWVGMQNPTEQLLSAVRDNLPAEVSGEVAAQLEQVVGTARPGLLSFGAIAALWAATGGMSSLIKAMNRAYDVEETRGFIPRTALAVVLTLFGSAGILVAFVTIVGGSVVTQEIGQRLGVGELAWTLITLARWPVVLLLLALAIGILFRLAPNVRVPWRYTLLGGLVFSVAWLVATGAFALYVANFANYANTYGALGGVIVLMLWFYLTGIVLVSAAELVAVIVKDREPERLEAGRQKALAAKGLDGSQRVGRSLRAPRRVPAGATAAGSHSPESVHLVPPPRVRRGAEAWERPADRGSTALAALIVGAGAVLGALLGRLAGEDAEDEA
jgi:membrane protein